MKNFRDYNFKPSDVIDGLNRFYEFTENHKDYLYAAFTIHTTEPSKSVWAFSKSRVPDAITYLREECDIFYTPGMKWDDLKYKLPTKACEKEFGTTDIREIYPRCLLLETAYYHELGFGEIKTIFHNIRYDCGFEDTRVKEDE